MPRYAWVLVICEWPLIFASGKREFHPVRFRVPVFRQRRPAELHFAETSSRAASPPLLVFQFGGWGSGVSCAFPALSAERYSQRVNLAHVAVLPKQRQKLRERVGVKLHWLRRSFRSRVGVEPCIANRQRQCARRKTGLAQSLARFLRKMA